MRVGQVIGTVTLGDSEPALKGGRFLLVSPLDREQLLALNETDANRIEAMKPRSGLFTTVVYDDIGAGRDDVIAFVEGAEATFPFKEPIPIDAYNVLIVDKTNYRPKLS